MGIYDPVLQAYQHGVDQQIQFASQPLTLADAILRGHQRGFQNRMQQEHLGLQRDQLAEQMRRAQAQEAEARLWHQGQEQNRLAQILQGTEITDNDQLGAWRKRIEGAGLPGEMLPKQLQQDPGNALAQGNFDANQQAANESPFDMAGPGGSSFEGERPADKLKPWRGSALGQKYAETERKASHNQVMEGLGKRKLDQVDIDQARKQGLTDAQIEALDFKVERGEELLPYEKSVLGERAALYSRLPTGNVVGGASNWRNGMAPDKQAAMVSKRLADLQKTWNANRNAALLKGKAAFDQFMAQNPQPDTAAAERDLDRGFQSFIESVTPSADNPNPALKIGAGGATFNGAAPGGSSSRAKEKLGIAPPNAQIASGEKIKKAGLKDGDQTKEGDTVRKIGGKWYIIPKGQ